MDPMFLSLIAPLIPKAFDAHLERDDSLIRADELMKLVSSPSGVATVVLLGFARRQLEKNASVSFDRSRTLYALAAAAAAMSIMLTLAAVMCPLTIRVVFTNDGGVETALLVYVLTHAVAVGTGVYSATVAAACFRELHAQRHE